MKLQMLLKLYILQCMSAWIGARVIEQSRGFFGDHFSNMEINDGNIYIGAKDYIYVLHASDLSSKETVSTCTGDCKSNLNKVLLVNKGQGQLIACGTGTEGTCEIRNLSSIENLVFRSSADGNDRLVSTDENRPAVFVIAPNTGGLYAGVTYGPGINPVSVSGLEAHITYNYYLANYSLFNYNFEKEINLRLSLSTITKDRTPEEYLVYFKGGFHHNKFVYFVTNQKLKVGNFSYTSKLIRLCQDDEEFRSYTDIILECKDGNQVYNLIQDISIFEPGEELRDNLTANGTVLAATFASGSDPEHPQQPSAVCLYKLEDIDRNVMIAKRKYIVCPGSSFNTHERYLKNNIIPNTENNKKCITESKYMESYVECNTDFGRFTYVTGDEKSALTASAVYTHSSTDQGVYLNKLQAGTTGKYTFLHIGTSDGKLHKVNVNSAEGVLYEEKIVDQGYPITGIHVEDDGKLEYVMSTRKIVRYETVNCSMYTTCQETMESRNPLCGWCVFENMSTFKENSSCPNQIRNGHWLSSLTECLSLKVEPGGVPINIGVIEVEVTASVLPDLLDFDVQCEFTVGSAKHNNGVRSVIGNTVKCRTPPSSEHTDGTLGLLAVSGSNKILLAETSFLFYDCAHYKLCGECTGDPRANCYWDSINTKCVSTPSGNIEKAGDCPKFQDDTAKHYIPAGITKTLTFNVANLVNSSTIEYRCRLSPTSAPVTAQKVGDNQIKCDLSGPISNYSMVDYSVEILYGSSRLDNMNTVEVYSCNLLGTDCSVCGSLMYTNINYECKWCSNTCQHPTVQCSDPCGAPSIQQVIPNTAAITSSINATIVGKQLGARYEDVQSIRLAGVPCDPKSDNFIPSRRVTCTVQGPAVIKSGNVVVMVNNQSSQESVPFSFKKPVISKVMPASGPKSGGTRITLSGDDLGVGTRNIKVYITDSEGNRLECNNPKVEPDVGLFVISSSPFTIECDTPPNSVDVMLNMIEVIFDGATAVSQSTNFTYVEDPVITDITRKAIAGGGNIQSVTGQNLRNAHKGYITGSGKRIYCTFKSETKMDCPALPLTANQKKDLLSIVNSRSRRKKRETRFAEGLTVEIIVHLDGVQQTFTIMYYVDPEFDQFDEEVKLFESRQQKLTIKGQYLNLVAEKGDVRVSVGVGSCDVIELTESNITCVPPPQQPAPRMSGADYPEVNVSIGNVHSNLGYLQYRVIEEKLDTKWSIIIGAIAACVVVIVVIGALVVFLKYRKKSKKMRDYQRHVEEQEMEIRQIFREEFADMHTSMMDISSNLIEQGCPYHHYQQYMFNIMFPADTMESHPLLHEPVVTDGARSKMRRGMEEFENLIFNKYFLISVINSLEKQRKFTLKDKANMVGYICAILFGRMEYLQEILVDLLGNLIHESSGKKTQKVLFRRNQTITEKLLGNWLSICLYPHLKSKSGWPLYLLYKATQLHMEAGPIDAVTKDAKYTLSEEKLLKKYSQQVREGSNEPRFEAKCLTLNVVVDNCRDIKVCRVLDCDTITQVKEKCLTQIYVNYPASNLTVNPEELELEWHAGQSGSLRLRDEDNTSKQEGSWVRLNTLAHYNVQDGSNMALIDPQIDDQHQEQDYANLAQIKLSATSDTSMDSTDALTASLVQHSKDPNVRYWHMVKPEEGTLAPGKSLIAELYLNRLLTFKQSILQYVRAIFDTVLTEEFLPPPVRFIYQQLDEMADKNKVDADIVHAWKSMSYPVRIWATLMKKPAIVFDIKSPPYVDTSMDVISQVFIDSVSVEAQKFSKDSPTHKLIFTNEMNEYKEKVRQFYKEISVAESQPENLRNFLEEVNKLQQQHCNFNKMSSLYKLYQQLEPYIAEVIDDLSTSLEACRLLLDKKLEQVNSLMEEE